MWTEHTILSVARLASALLGTLLFVAALRAYTTTRRRSMLALATGAGVLTAGYLLAGSLVEFLGWAVQDATMLESVFTLVAISLLVASLYLRDSHTVRTKTGKPEIVEVANG